MIFKDGESRCGVDRKLRPSVWQAKAIELFGVLAVLAVCLAMVFWKSQGRLTERIPVGDDSQLALCMLQWDIAAVRQGRSWYEFWQLPCLYPEPYMLANSDPLLGGAVLYAPLLALSRQPILAFNLWIMLLVALNFLSAYFVARRLLGSKLPALYCGLLFSVPFVRLGQADHWHMWPHFLTPWLFLAANRVAEGGSWRWSLTAGILLAGQFYFSIYLGFMAAFMLAVLLVTLFCHRPGCFIQRRWLLSVALGALVSAFLLTPLVLPYSWAASRWGSPSWQEILIHLPHWKNFVTGWANERTMWFGLGPLILSLGGLAGVCGMAMVRPARLPFWCRAAGVLLAVLACLTVNQWHSYQFLYRFVPGFSAMRCPARWTLLTVWPAALLGGWLLTYLGRFLAQLTPMASVLAGVGVLALVVDENLLPFPWASVKLPDVNFYRTVVRRLPPGPHIDLPLNGHQEPPSNHIYGQRLQGQAAAGWRPAFNLFSGRVPPWFESLVDREWTITTPEQAACLLGEWRLRGIRWVILHKDELGKDPLRAWLAARNTAGESWASIFYEDDRHLVLDLAKSAPELCLNPPSPSLSVRPCTPLRPGRYEAIFDLHLVEGAVAACEVHSVDLPTNRAKPLFRQEVLGTWEGHYPVISFAIPDKPGPEPILEFRVICSCPKAVRFHRVTIRPLAKDSPSDYASRDTAWANEYFAGN
jgi:hypothetical protein